MQIARVFFDVHMGKNFKGLISICHKSGMKPEAETKSYVVFVNHNHTKFKLMIGRDYLVYHDNGNRRFPLDAIKYLPNAFSGGQFQFSRALEKSVKSHMNDHMRKYEKPGAELRA